MGRIHGIHGGPPGLSLHTRALVDYGGIEAGVSSKPHRVSFGMHWPIPWLRSGGGGPGSTESTEPLASILTTATVAGSST